MLLKTVENTYSSESNDKPQKEEQVSAISIEQAKHALKSLNNFVKNTTSMALFLLYRIWKTSLKIKTKKITFFLISLNKN